MKIRITKKGLLKAQAGFNDCPQGYSRDINGNCVQQLQMQTNQQNSAAWTNFNPQPVPQLPLPKIDMSAFIPKRIVTDADVLPEERPQEVIDQSTANYKKPDVYTGIGPEPYKNDPIGKQLQARYDSDPALQKQYDEGVGAAMMKGLKPFGSRKEMKSYVNFYNNKYKTNYKLPFMTPDRVKLTNKISNWGDALGVASNVVDYYTNKKKANDWQRYFKQNMYDQGASGEYEGNYQTNTGVFQPNLLPSPNEGMFMYGGTMINDTDMKIRIKEVPEMAYGGQSGYGLDLGQRNVYGDMAEDRTVSSTVSAVPRDEANIEAEGGETLYGDVDGDGVNEHMKISGPRHTQGGVPLNAPEGSFIFSDTKKMKIKDPEILKAFGVSYKAGGITPASIAKKYDINKYKAILEDPNADVLSKSTAQMMVKNYQNKLANLAMVQEGMKGFPQGVPQVAEGLMDAAQFMGQAAYGGYMPLYKAQNGGGKEEEIFNTKVIEDLKKQGYDIKYSPRIGKGDTKVPILQGKQKTGLYGDIQMDEIAELKARHPWYFASRPNWNPANPDDVLDFQTRYDDEFAKQKGYSYFDGTRTFSGKDKKLGEYTYNAPGLDMGPKEEVRQKWKCTANGVVAVNPNTPTGGGYFNITEPLFDRYEDAVAACTPKEPEKKIPPNPNLFKENPELPFGYMTPDLVDMFANAAVPPSVTFGYRPKAAFEPGKYVLEDWLSKAQQRQQAFNTASQTLGTYGPASGLAANLSFMAGQTGDGVSQDISAVDSRNVDRANIALATERQRKDQNNLFNLAQSQELWRDNAIAKQQYDNARRAYLRDNAKSFATAWNNRMNLGLVNATNPMYNIDPLTGRSYFKKGFDTSKLGLLGVGNNAGSNEYWSRLNDGYMTAKSQFPDLTSGQYLSAMRVLNTSSDRNGDGIPDATTTRSAIPGFDFGGYVTYPF